jgi:hypothetical protein
MAMLTTDQILKVDDLKSEIVEVPEWGGSVKIRTMTGTERDRFESSVSNDSRGKNKRINLENIRARLVALAMVDDDGERLFRDDQVKELGKKSAAALDRVFAVAQRLNGLSGTDVEELSGN